MLVVAGNGEEPNRQDKNKYADQEKQESVHDYSTLGRFNDCAVSSSTGGGLYKAKEGGYQPLPIRRLSLSWLLVSFFGVDKHTYDNKKWPQDAKGYTNRIRKFLEEIACQTDGNDGFSEIANNFRDKFSSRVVNNRFHRLSTISFWNEAVKKNVLMERGHELVQEEKQGIRRSGDQGIRKSGYQDIRISGYQVPQSPDPLISRYPDALIPWTGRSAGLFRLVTPVLLALFTGILLFKTGTLQATGTLTGWTMILLMLMAIGA